MASVWCAGRLACKYRDANRWTAGRAAQYHRRYYWRDDRWLLARRPDDQQQYLQPDGAAGFLRRRGHPASDRQLGAARLSALAAHRLQMNRIQMPVAELICNRHLY